MPTISVFLVIARSIKIILVFELIRKSYVPLSATNETDYNESVMEEAEAVLNKLFHSDYNKNIRPFGKNGSGPTIVTVQPYIRHIDYIDDVNMEYGLEITLRQKWLDKRLDYTNITKTLPYLTLLDKSKLWQPDLFFSNEKRGHIHEVLTPNYMIRIRPDGETLTSIRISLKLNCPMNLKTYPFDKPSCSMLMASYSWSDKDLIFKWQEKDPVEMQNKNVSLARFKFNRYETGSCSSNTKTGIYSCIKLDFYFDRDITFYLMQIYIPSCMIVVISWLAFWLDERATDARISLGVTSILTMVTQIYGINQNSPSVSYMKALDVWTATCQIFVVGTLVEFSLVNHAYKISKAGKRNQHSSTNDFQQLEFSDSSIKDSSKAFSINVFGYLRKQSKARKIDLIARLLFPFAFSCFNGVYWLSYYQP